MVFAFDPFFGYFAGPLYDTVIDAFWTLATYRAGTLLTLLAVGCAASFFDDRLRFQGFRGRCWLFRCGPLGAHRECHPDLERCLARTFQHARVDRAGARAASVTASAVT